LDEELRTMKEFAIKNPKNYMMWNYLSFLCEKIDKIEWLFTLTSDMIANDVFNNSAYSCRFSCLKKLKELGKDIIANEKNFLINLVEKSSKDIKNLSLKNYINGYIIQFKDDSLLEISQIKKQLDNI
ncbi:MAG: CAAX geranylgeranyltransferase alpha subunit, partial [Paramarteilia canceri]